MKPRVAPRNPLFTRRSRPLPAATGRGVKFLCDRCETRYSIADERVRGKILKIRCKTCQHVITVREGMTADPDLSSALKLSSRTKHATTMAPVAHEERNERSVATARPREASVATARPREASVAQPAPRAADASRSQAGRAAGAATRGAEASRGQDARRGAGRGLESRGEPVNALNAAFASAMAKPPPALEEEWYVSIDGDQSGPFSLAEAQRWVAGKAFDAELHCWSEGFDDWLPVDKVSHFRGLRKRPAPAPAPPPVPRGGGRAAPAPALPKPEAEPKPLFAATMASLERGAPPASSPAIQLPPPARATPPQGVPVQPRGVNGAAPTKLGTRPEPAIQPRGGESGAHGKLDARPADSRPGSGARKPIDVRDPGPAGSAAGGQRGSIDVRDPGPAGSAAGGQRGSIDPFDTSEAADSATQLQAAPFPETPADGRRTELRAGVAPPASAVAPPASPAAPPAAALPPGLQLAGVSSKADFDTDDDDGDGEDLAIGEVSRVVNLADLSRTRSAAAPVRRGTGAVGRLTGGNPLLRSTNSLPSLPTAAPVDGVAPADGEPDPAAAALAPVAKTHRRGLIALLSVAVVMIVGAAVVVLFVTNTDDSTDANLGRVHDIDTSRPEDPITHRPLEPGAASPNPFLPRPIPHPRPVTPNPPPGHDEPLPGNSLRSDEIEDMAHKHQDVTQRCYMRAQRGADSIIVGDVKKIAVTLTIDRDGNVTDVGLSEHGADNLGKCLIASMKGWKFRASAGGAFRISLVFGG